MRTKRDSADQLRATDRRVSRANRNKAKAGVSWVYMIQAGDNGPIKIGQTRELRTRVRALQAMHYEPLSLIGMIPETWIAEDGTVDDEDLARAAIAAMRGELRKLPNTQYAIDTMTAALGGTDAA